MLFVYRDGFCNLTQMYVAASQIEGTNRFPDCRRVDLPFLQAEAR